MDPRIILAGQTVNPVNALAMGNQAGQQQNDMRYQQDYRAAVQQYGAGALGGDQASMNALAAFDPQVAQNLAVNQLGMDNTRLNMSATEQSMRYLDDNQRMAVEQHAAGLSQGQRAEQAAAVRSGVAAGMQAQTPEQWDAYMSQDPSTQRYVGQFGNREMIAGSFLEMADAIEMSTGTLGNGGNTNVTVNGGQEPTMGTIPQGFEVFLDPETNRNVMRPIAGGPADVSTQTAAAEQSQVNQATLVSEDINRVKEIVLNNPRLTTGFLGPVMTRFAGSDASDVSSLLTTLEANIAFNALQEMRNNSPTGGALGAVSERELLLLSATMGSLKQSQSSGQFIENLERLDRQMNEIINGPAAASPAANGDIPPVPPAMLQNGSITAAEWPGVWENMTPAQRALFE